MAYRPYGHIRRRILAYSCVQESFELIAKASYFDSFMFTIVTRRLAMKGE